MAAEPFAVLNPACSCRENLLKSGIGCVCSRPSKFLQLLQRAEQSWAIGVADIELIPSRDEALPPVTADQQSHSYAKPFGKPRPPDDIFGDDGAASTLLGAKFLEPPHRLVLAVEYATAEKPVQPQLRRLEIRRGIPGLARHDEKGNEPTQRRRRCSTRFSFPKSVV